MLKFVSGGWYIMYCGNYVRLRELRKEDVEKAQKFFNVFEVRNLTQSKIPYPFKFDDEKKFYDSISADNDEYTFAIEDLTKKLYIGSCGVNSIDWKNRHAEIGIFIGNKDFWNKGYGTDAMSLLVKFVFEQMNIHKIKLSVFSFNKRAIRCYEKCGFKVDGVLREEVFKDGQYYDEILMSLLKCEYNEK